MSTNALILYSMKSGNKQVRTEQNMGSICRRLFNIEPIHLRLYLKQYMKKNRDIIEVLNRHLI
jgi:hypothetical protein